jgi:hypothetical protein
MALNMKNECETCGKAVPPDSGDAYVCSSERTYCGACAQDTHYNCPKCGGELARRPRAPKVANNQ